jgi:chromate transport protein ChrA
MSDKHAVFRQHWREVIGIFLKLGALSYGGPALMGIMQMEVQEKRAWMTREWFLDGLALVNTLPGPGATQLGIFLARLYPLTRHSKPRQ